MGKGFVGTAVIVPQIALSVVLASRNGFVRMAYMPADKCDTCHRDGLVFAAGACFDCGESFASLFCASDHLEVNDGVLATTGDLVRCEDCRSHMPDSSQQEFPFPGPSPTGGTRWN